ncbi:MAG TPA: hypothetical protein VL225_09510 [Vicinamibacterales bacterium]|nr:hypothetical protein [Vicinamibacterales bacterium]
MSPILVRPVREQLEHDRVIRLLQAKLKRKHEVAANVGDEQVAGVRIGVGQMFPDLVLMSPEKAHRLEGIVEVETSESVNHLEAMAQWAHFGRAKVPFYLYVPAAAVDMARRLCVENQVDVAEVWSFHTIADQTRFTLAYRSNSQRSPAPRAQPERSAKPEPRKRPRPAAPARKAARAKKSARPERTQKRK